MADIFDFGPKTARYAVMGNPIAHSKSPRIHQLFAEQTGEPIEYLAIQVDPGGFKQAVGNFQATGGQGLNVTVPFKQEAFDLSDLRSDRAELAGAVNTLRFDAGRTYGDNTDGIGLVRDLIDNHGLSLGGHRVLLLGAGGAARGVLGPLLEQDPSKLVIANRTPGRARDLAAAFAGRAAVEGCGYDDLGETPFDLIINATAASLQGELPPVPVGLLTRAVCYDMMYAAEPTVFMRWAEAQGAARVFDGLGMLVEQAAESFSIWRRVRPETAPVIRTLRGEMQSAG